MKLEFFIDTNVLFALRKLVPLNASGDGALSLSDFLIKIKNDLSDNYNIEGNFCISNQWQTDKPGPWTSYRHEIDTIIETGALKVLEVDRNADRWWDISTQARSSHFITSKRRPSGENEDPYDVDLLYLLDKFRSTTNVIVTDDFGILKAVFYQLHMNGLTLGGFLQFLTAIGIPSDDIKHKHDQSENIYRKERALEHVEILMKKDQVISGLFNKVFEHYKNSQEKQEKIEQTAKINSTKPVKRKKRLLKPVSVLDRDYSIPLLFAYQCNDYSPRQALMTPDCLNCKLINSDKCPRISDIKELSIVTTQSHCLTCKVKIKLGKYCTNCAIMVDLLTKVHYSVNQLVSSPIPQNISTSPPLAFLHTLSILTQEISKFDPYFKIAQHIFTKLLFNDDEIDLGEIQKELGTMALRNEHFYPFVFNGFITPNEDSYKINSIVENFTLPYNQYMEGVPFSNNHNGLTVFHGQVLLNLFIEYAHGSSTTIDQAAMQKSWSQISIVYGTAYNANKTIRDNDIDKFLRKRGLTQSEILKFKHLLGNRLKASVHSIVERAPIAKTPLFLKGRQEFDLHSDFIRIVNFIRQNYQILEYENIIYNEIER